MLDIHRSRWLSYDTEKNVLQLALLGFSGSLILNFSHSQWPTPLLLHHPLYIFLLSFVILHFGLVLLKSLWVPKQKRTKMGHFLILICTGHIGAWIYTLVISPKYVPSEPLLFKAYQTIKRPTIKDKIQKSKIFKPITEKIRTFLTAKSGTGN